MGLDYRGGAYMYSGWASHYEVLVLVDSGRGLCRTALVWWMSGGR